MATKIRDTATGEILRTAIYTPDPESKEGEEFHKNYTNPYIIVDDICDGGRTFIEIAKVIRNEIYNDARVELYVTHGIFSKGMEVFEGLIDKIFYYDMGEFQCWSSAKSLSNE